MTSCWAAHERHRHEVDVGSKRLDDRDVVVGQPWNRKLGVGEVDTLARAELAPRGSHDLQIDAISVHRGDHPLDRSVVEHDPLAGSHRAEQLLDLDRDMGRSFDAAVGGAHGSSTFGGPQPQLQDLSGAEHDRRSHRWKTADLHRSDRLSVTTDRDLDAGREVDRPVGVRIACPISSSDDAQSAPTPAGVTERELVAGFDCVQCVGDDRHDREVAPSDLDELFGSRIDAEAHSYRTFDTAEVVASRPRPHHRHPGRQRTGAKLRSGEIDRHSHVSPSSVGPASDVRDHPTPTLQVVVGRVDPSDRHPRTDESVDQLRVVCRLGRQGDHQPGVAGAHRRTQRCERVFLEETTRLVGARPSPAEIIGQPSVRDLRSQPRDDRVDGGQHVRFGPPERAEPEPGERTLLPTKVQLADGDVVHQVHPALPGLRRQCAKSNSALLLGLECCRSYGQHRRKQLRHRRKRRSVRTRTLRRRHDTSIATRS